MNTHLETATANYIARWFAQEGLCMVPKKGLRYKNDVSWSDIEKVLNKWADKKWVRVIKSPDVAELNEPCIELLTWPGSDQPFPQNWVRDRPLQ